MLDVVKLIHTDEEHRIFHSHGHSVKEIYELRFGHIKRVVDAVIYPENHDQVEKIVEIARHFNVVLFPYGGGTNVTESLECEENEERMIVSVDMGNMDKILWVDKVNMMCCVEAGIKGQDLERKLRPYGFCTGHIPDSLEFSTAGGWVSTRASGMKKNVYGNIEDMLINVKIVTPKGTFTKAQNCPRVSSGPDINQMILGSEGNFGIITEVTLRIRPLPEVRIYDSIIFPDFNYGQEFMMEMGKRRCRPASVRTVDNLQFKFGYSMKGKQKS